MFLKILLCTIFFACSFLVPALALSDDREARMQKQLEEVMKARDEMLRSLLDDSNFQDMNARMEKLLKSFGGDDFFLDTGDTIGEYDWVETKTHQILSLKVKQIKDRPLDIKIKQGKITIKGDVESQSTNTKQKKISRIHFERVFSIPQGVDETNPEFENKEGELLIKFKKKVALSPKKDLMPVSPDSDDQTI